MDIKRKKTPQQPVMPVSPEAVQSEPPFEQKWDGGESQASEAVEKQKMTDRPEQGKSQKTGR